MQQSAKPNRTLIGQIKTINGIQGTPLQISSHVESKLALPEPQSTTRIDRKEPINVPDARGYNELMDVYSLHQLMIRKGTLLEQTPEFISFKRTYIQRWGSIAYVLHLLEKLMSDAQVELCYVEGRKIA